MPFKIGFSRAAPAKSSAREPRAPTFHAVSVRPTENACQAALDARSARILSHEAPRLPLEGCDRPAECTCRYQHFEDRRDKPRRRTEGAPPSAAASNQEERRRLVGRRAEDHLDDVIEESEQPEELADTYYGYRRKPD